MFPRMLFCCVSTQVNLYEVLVFGSKKGMFSNTDNIQQQGEREHDETASASQITTDTSQAAESGGTFGQVTEAGLEIIPVTIGGRRRSSRHRRSTRRLERTPSKLIDKGNEAWVVFAADAESKPDFELFSMISKNFASKIILILVGPEGQEDTLNIWKEQVDLSERLFPFYYSNPDLAIVNRDVYNSCLGFGTLNTLAIGGFMT